jgi:ribosomal protein S18 acetylase RimI-like enzyme
VREEAEGVDIRRATESDQQLLRELWEEFESEIPPPPEYVETWEEEWADLAADIGGRGVVLLAEAADGVVGTVRATMRRTSEWYVALAYVRPHVRGRGVLKRLLREALREGRERGSERVTLHALAANEVGLAVWRRLGFRFLAHYLEAPLDGLEARLEEEEGTSTGAVYVQTDDRDKVERAVAKYLPRIGRSESTAISAPDNGWVRIDDELCSRDPSSLRRLGRELSLAFGAIVLTLGIEEGALVRYVLWDRGGVADEYASVPEHYGPLPPGDVVALGANPTVAQRLTGADPSRVRAVARTAASPNDLPPPDELHRELAKVLGVRSGS